MIRQSFLDYIAPRQLLIILLQLTSKTKKKVISIRITYPHA